MLLTWPLMAGACHTRTSCTKLCRRSSFYEEETGRQDIPLWVRHPGDRACHDTYFVQLKYMYHESHADEDPSVCSLLNLLASSMNHN